MASQSESLYNSFQHNDGVWILIQVCKHWRRVISSTPSLWRFVYVACDGLVNHNAELEQQLLLSKNQLLDVRIGIGRFSTDYSALSVLAKSTHRWRSLVISIDPDALYLTAGIQIIRDSGFPSLTHLSLVFQVLLPDMNVFSVFGTMFSRDSAPNLRSVVSKRAPWSLPSVVPMWAMLEYQGSGMKSVVCTRMLHECPLLHVLTLDDLFDEVPDSIAPIPSFHFLHTLSLCGMEHWLTSLIDLLTLPSLASFSCTLWSGKRSGRMSFPIDAFEDMIYRSGCARGVKEIHLRGGDEWVRFDDFMLHRLAVILPELEVLTLMCPIPLQGDRAFRELALTPGNEECMFPTLKELWIFDSAIGAIGYYKAFDTTSATWVLDEEKRAGLLDALGELVETRRKHGAQVYFIPSSRTRKVLGSEMEGVEYLRPSVRLRSRL